MTSEQLIYHQKNSITLYSLKNFEDTLTTNKFKRSDMDIYMAYDASDGVYEYVQKAQDRGFFGQKYVQEVKTSEQLIYHQKDSRTLYSLKMLRTL